MSIPPLPEGWDTTSDLPGVDTRRRYATVDTSLRPDLIGVGLEKFPSDAIHCAVLAAASFASGVSDG